MKKKNSLYYIHRSDQVIYHWIIKQHKACEIFDSMVIDGNLDLEILPAILLQYIIVYVLSY